MGNYFDAMFSKFEQQANNSGMLAGMTPAERADFYGRMSVRIQNQELAQGLSGTQNLPAVITNPTGGTPNLPAVIGDVIETPSTNKGINVVKKWSSKDGKACYLADRAGNFYKVDKATFNAAKAGRTIKPADVSAVDFDKLPTACQRQFRKYLPTPAEAATAAVTTPKNTNPSHPTNTTLGTAKADPTDWRQRTGKTNFNDGPKWGGAEANKIAQETIAGNRVQTPNHNYNVVNDPQGYRNQQQAMYDDLFGKGEQVPTHNYNVVNDPQAYRNQQQAMYDDLFGKGEQVTTHNYNVVNDPQAYRNQQQAMYDDLFGKGEQVPMHNYNVVNDPQAYRNQQQAMYDDLFGKVDDIADDAGNAVHNHYHTHKTVINKIDDVRINELTDKVDDIGNEVGKVKRGMGEAFGKTIAKIDDLGQNIDDIGKNVTQLTDKVDDVAQNVGKLKRGLGEVSGKIIAKVDDNADAIKTLTSKVDDMAKTNKKMALIGGAIALAGIAAAGIAGYFMGKADNEEKAEGTKPEGTQPEVIEVPDENENVVPPVILDGEDDKTPEIPDGNEDKTPEIPDGNEDKTPEVPDGNEDKTPEVPDNNDNNDHNPILNTDGTFTVGKGVKNGTFWGIAEQILEWTYRNEPDKFKNLSVNQRNVMIQKETDRLMELNKRGKKEVTVNGKTWIVPEPTIHPGDKIKTQEEKAA